MSIRELLSISFTNLRSNKLRSFLTLLGVIIGVGCVIVMISLIEGGKRNVVREFESVGSNLVLVVYQPERRAAGEKRGTFEGLTQEDAEAIRKRCPLVAVANPSMQAPLKVRYAGQERTITVIGASEYFNDVLNVKVERGRSITPDDVKEWSRVCIIGPKVSENMFESEDPMGKELLVRGVRLKVVGVMEKRGATTFGEDRDNQIYVPLSVMHRRLLGTRLLAGIEAKAVDPELANQAADQIWRVLIERHEDARNDLIVDTQSRMLEAIGRIFATFGIVLGFIGALSLLVGGIGIMNIMLVTVTERTREIGIRKAIGAKRRDILIQFLMESMTLSGVGGVIGVGFGAGLSWFIGFVMQERLPTYVPPWVMVMAFTFACCVGIFFGIYPAYRAAKLDPVECLRYE